MKRLLKWTALVIGALVALFIIVGFLLPAGYQIERSLVIGAAPGQIHVLVGDLKRWPEWTPWQEVDPSIRTVLGETTTGVGASQTWQGESGTGELVFTRCEPNWGVAYDLVFGDNGLMTHGSVRYEKVADGTKVTWSMQGDMGNNIIGRYFGLMLDSLVGSDFERGLAKLKSRVESS